MKRKVFKSWWAIFPSGALAASLWTAEVAPAGYLFAHMTRQDYGRLYYSVSSDGLHWRPLNGGNRISEEYRGHPDLCKGHDGRFYLLGNQRRDSGIVIWVSTNLVRWEKWREFVPDVKHAADFSSSLVYHGAPKIYYDAVDRQYVLTWHTPTLPGDPRDPEAHWRSMRTLFVTSKDLSAFTQPRRLFAFDWATIDVLVRREGDRCYAILKDELWPTFAWPTGKSIRIAAAAQLTGPYPEPGPRLTPNFREAPTVIRRPDGKGWYLYCEQYPGVSYHLSTAPSLAGPWHDVFHQDYSMPAGVRHGSMIPLTRSEWDTLLKAFERR